MPLPTALPPPQSAGLAEVVVLGAAAVDWVARVDRLPPPDGIAWADSYQAYPGGSGGNIAAALARLGFSTCFAGKLGDDGAGRILLDDFTRAGVSLQGLRIMPGQASASCFIAVEESGARQIFALGGTALYEDPEELDPAWFSQARALVISDAFPPVALAAAGFCPPGAIIISNPGGLMVSQPEAWFDPLLACRPILVVSQREGHQLSGQAQPLQAASQLREKGFPVVLQTLGEAGALLAFEDKFYQICASQPARVVDTTGAGDAFVAGFTAGLLVGMGWIHAVAAGIRVADAKIAQPGARSGIPDRGLFNRLNQEASIDIEEVKP